MIPALASQRATYATALLVIALDQVTKWLVLERFGMLHSPPLQVTPFFNLVMVWNHGVSFGMFSHLDARWPLIALAVGVSVFLLRWNRTHVTGLPRIAVGLVVGGALGNVIDRLRFGAVADFLDVHFAGYHWPAFNVADACIVTGVGLLFLHEVRRGRETASP